MKFRLLLILLLLPLFWIGINNSHDWGDDYAQYLLQAKNLVQNRTQTNTNLVFAKGELPYAIVAYPVGFPLLLAPLFAVYGLYIPAYLYLNSLILILTALLFFDYLKKTFDVKMSFLMVLFFAYNIISLVLKMEILSEFSFALFLIGIMLCLKPEERKTFLIAGIFSGILISIRISGLVILPAVFIWLMLMQRQISYRKRWINLGIFLAVTTSIFFILNGLLFDINVINFFFFYANQFSSNRLMVPTNFFSFFENIATLFIPTIKSAFITLPLLIIISTGFYKKLKDKGVAECFFLFYLLLIVVYPYSASGIRFIYPVLPFVLVYFVKGFQTIYQFITSKDKSFMILTIIFCSSNIISFKVLRSLPKPDGPYASDAKSVLNFIRRETPEDAIVLFSRARAVNLYGERRSTFLIQHKNEQENLKNLKNLKCDYILYADERSGAFNQSLQDFLLINKTEFDTIYKADRYLLLKMKVNIHP